MNKPGDKNYVCPDTPQPCENKGLRSVPRTGPVSQRYRDNFDRIFRKTKTEKGND